MEGFYLYLMSSLLVLAGHGGDPAWGFWQGRQELRNLECERMTQQRAHDLYPVRVPEPSPRTETLTSIDALVCSPRIVPFGERPARDEVVLTTLRARVAEFSQTASAVHNDVTTWYVDAFYPELTVATRIATAARTQLAERGMPVSNRVPLLAAGDLLVLRDLDVARAFPVACARYFAEHSLADKEALLGIALVDERVSELHAGVCRNGVWRWLL